MVKDGSCIVIQPFMVNELNLKGSELIAYAVIYGACKTENSSFSGFSRDIAAWCGIDRKNVFAVLKKLVEKGLIEKTVVYSNGVRLCEYRTTR